MQQKEKKNRIIRIGRSGERELFIYGKVLLFIIPVFFCKFVSRQGIFCVKIYLRSHHMVQITNQ